MAEAFSFELKLVDDVSRNAKKAADSLRGVENQAKKTHDAMDFSKELEKTEQALHKLGKDPAGYTKLLKAQKELAEQRQKLAKQAGVGRETFGEALGKKFNFGLLTSAAFAGEVLAEGAFKLGEGLVEAAHKVVEIFTEGLAKAFEESGKEEKKRLAFRLSLGAEGGKESREDIERFSKLTAYTEDEVAKMFLPLRRAGFNQKAARSAFAAAADIEAGGGVSANEALDTFTNIKLKGGINERKLVGMGVNAPEFYKTLAKKLGTNSETAKKRAEEGKLDPQLLLNTIYEGIEKRQGGKLGTGAVAAGNTFEARLHKLQNLPNQYFEKLVDSPGFQKVSDAFGKLLEKLDPDSEAGQRIMASLNSMFERIIGWFDSLTSDNGIDDIASGIQTAVATLEKGVDFASKLVDWLKTAAGVAESVAAPLAKAMEFGDKLLGRDQGGDFSDAATAKDLQNRLRVAVASGVVKQGDIGGIVNQWRNAHVSAPTTINVVGVDHETGKKAGAEVHRNMVSAHERASQEGG